ncbi:MAG: helix-turn-helix domain-containing protein [Bacillota bacterium]
MDNYYENDIWFTKEEFHNLEFPLSSVEYFKIIFVSRGVLQITTADDSFELFEGDCRFFFPGEVHSAFTYDNNVCEIVSFPTSACEDFFAMVFGRQQVGGVFKLDSDIDYFESISADADVFFNKANLYALLHSFVGKVVISDAKSKDGEFVAYVTNFVRKNCKDDISLASLAENLGYGYNYVSTLFKKNFKCNFLFFVNQHRIAIAEEMLKSQPDMTITEIAFECGFNSLRSFGRNFQMHKGIAPSESRG